MFTPSTLNKCNTKDGAYSWWSPFYHQYSGLEWVFNKYIEYSCISICQTKVTISNSIDKGEWSRAFRKIRYFRRTCYTPPTIHICDISRSGIRGHSQQWWKGKRNYNGELVPINLNLCWVLFELYLEECAMRLESQEWLSRVNWHDLASHR